MYYVLWLFDSCIDIFVRFGNRTEGVRVYGWKLGIFMNYRQSARLWCYISQILSYYDESREAAGQSPGVSHGILWTKKRLPGLTFSYESRKKTESREEKSYLEFFSSIRRIFGNFSAKFYNRGPEFYYLIINEIIASHYRGNAEDIFLRREDIILSFIREPRLSTGPCNLSKI